MAIETKNQTAPVVDDESPVPTQVPTHGQDDHASEGTERGPTRTSKGEEDRGERTGDRGARRVDGDEPSSFIERATPEAQTMPVVMPVAAAPPAPRSAPALVPVKSKNSTDATQGEPLPVRASIRRGELEELLEHTDDVRTRQDVELALSSLAQLLTGDPEHLSAPTAAALNRWLEGAKHLGETTPTVAPAPARRAS